MSNHFHALIRTPDENLNSIMNYLIREVSRKIGSVSGRINRIFGGRYKWCLIEDDKYFHQVYKYVYQNPCRAGLVGRVEQYSFSTIHHLAYRIKLPFELHDSLDDTHYRLPAQKLERLLWLNEAEGPIEIEKVRRGLKRTHFLPPTHHKVYPQLQHQIF